MSRTIDLSEMPLVSDPASAEAFIRWCCRAIGLAFHPDTDFKDYVEADGNRTFTDDEAAVLENNLFAAFGQLRDPYAIGLDEFQAMQGGRTDRSLDDHCPIPTPAAEPTAASKEAPVMTTQTNSRPDGRVVPGDTHDTLHPDDPLLAEWLRKVLNPEAFQGGFVVLPREAMDGLVDMCRGKGFVIEVQAP